LDLTFDAVRLLARCDRAQNDGMPSDAPLSGRTVAITGAARGIGLATATALAAAGAHVVLGDLDGNLAAVEAQRLGALGLALDVTDEESFAAFLGAAEREGGGLDVLINNAGIMPTGPFLAQSSGLTEQMFAVNVLGVMRGVRLALPAMLERGGGQIVNVASVAGRQVAAGMAGYCATKHAVVGFTRALRREHHASGVRFTLVMPSFTRTRMTEGALSGRVPAADPADVGRGITAAVIDPRDEVILPRSAAVLVHAFERLLPAAAADAIARRLGADEQFIAANGTARQAQWREVAR
jgi:NAD(P)-dependent dehydrogenase (short-subunit alcohol dehydrogenase family)